GGELTVAVTGAAAKVTVDGATAAFAAPVRLPAGAVLTVGPAKGGVRGYLAVGGGIAVPPVLGSRSTDTLSGLGPPVVRDGDRLPVGDPPPRGSGPDLRPAEGAGSVPPEKSIVELRVRLGPRADWFTPEAVATMLRAEYVLSPTSNRVGARLTGPALERAVDGELPSEGVVLGAVQVPANGQPLIFLADHPTTGGYPVIAVVDADDLPLVAQTRPGTTVRFRPA
ncbi:MAG: biotin-dependent carboxyltransferase family protein, partial [Micromonosporaceae bacterium]